MKIEWKDRERESYAVVGAFTLDAMKFTSGGWSARVFLSAANANERMDYDYAAIIGTREEAKAAAERMLRRLFAPIVELAIGNCLQVVLSAVAVDGTTCSLLECSCEASKLRSAIYDEISALKAGSYRLRDDEPDSVPVEQVETPSSAASTLRHATNEFGDCQHWCLACSANKRAGLNPDGTVPDTSSNRGGCR